MLNDLFGGIVDDFMEKTDEMIDKVEEWKNDKVGYFSSDEKTPVVVMGENAKVEDINGKI